MSADEDQGAAPDSPGPGEQPSEPTHNEESANLEPAGDDAEMETSPFPAPSMEEINLSNDFPPPKERDDE